MRPPNNIPEFELICDPAPEQFSEPKDLFMRYIIRSEGLDLNTDDFTPKQMAKICRDMAKWLEKTARYLDRKKHNGNQYNRRCT